MSSFDPFESTFDHSVDPITADEQGLAVLGKLEEAKMTRRILSKTMDERTEKTLADGEAKLLVNAQHYKNYKEDRNEEMFGYEAEVKARANQSNIEELARYAVPFLTQDDDSFDDGLDKSGDKDQFMLDGAFLQDKEKHRENYSLNQLLKRSGYSWDEIYSGAAEPQMRPRLNAGPDESTRDAYLRWSRQKVVEFDRNKELMDSLDLESRKSYMGMTDDVNTFEVFMADPKNKGLSENQRSNARRIWGLNRKKLERDYKTIRPLVQKTFNTISALNELPNSFEGKGEFKDMEAASRAMGKIPLKDWGKLTAMLAQTAKDHGQNVDEWMGKLQKSFGRPMEGLFREGARPLDVKKAEQNLKIAKSLTGISYLGTDKFYVTELLDKDGNSLGFDLAPRTGGTDSLIGTLRGDTTTFTAEGVEKSINERRQRASYPKGSEGSKQQQNTTRVLTSKDDLARAVKGFEQQKRGEQIASKLYNWRDEVARINHNSKSTLGNMVMDDWVYGVVGSLPEMGAAATGLPGLMLVASAQSERNMADIRDRVKPEDWENQRAPALAAGVAYGLLNYAQLRTVTKRLPVTQNVIKKMGTILGIEFLQENAQDISHAVAQEIYGAVNEDVKDFDMFPTERPDWSTTDVGEKDGELVALIKRAPRLAFALVPFALAGGGGSAAMKYVSEKDFRRTLNDDALMGNLNIEPEELAELRKKPVAEAMDIIQEKFNEFTKDATELELPNVETEAQIHAQPDGTFKVSLNGKEAVAKSPEEVAEAVQQLDPEVIERNTPAAPVAEVVTIPIEQELDMLSEKELQSNWKKVDKELEVLETNFDNFDGEIKDFPQMAEMKSKQVEWQANKLERAKRSAKDQFKEDVFDDYQTLVGDLGEPTQDKADSYNGRLARIQFEVLQDAFESGELTLESASKEMQEIYKSSNDRLELLQGNQKRMAEWKNFFDENDATPMALPAPVATPEQAVDLSEIDSEIAEFDEKGLQDSIDSIRDEPRPEGQRLTDEKIKELRGLEAKKRDLYWLKEERFRLTSKDGPPVSAKDEASYNEAVESGDTKASEKMVADAAKKAGFRAEIVYHGSHEAFTEFDPNLFGSIGGQQELGFFFSSNPDIAENFEGPDGSSHKVYLRLENPKVMKASEHGIKDLIEDDKELGRIIEAADRSGHDGIILKDVDVADLHVAFYPSQIKSAEAVTYDNNGKSVPLSKRFDTDSDMRGDVATPEQATTDESIDDGFKADMVFHSFLAPQFGNGGVFNAGEKKSRQKDALPPRPDEATGEYTKAAAFRFGLQKFFGQRDIPSKTLQKTLTEGTRRAAGVEAQFNDLALALNDRLNRHIADQPKATQDAVYKQLQSDSFLGLRGDNDALSRLPQDVRGIVEQGRESIDIYSQELIDTGAISGDLADAVEDNIGSYITREFKVYDSKAKWNYQTVTKKRPDLYDAALVDIMAQGKLSKEDADLVIREMLSASKSRRFLAGNSTIAKINVSNLIKKKDLSSAILNLLGEVRNPAVNIKNTGTTVSGMAVTNAAQAHMAEQLLTAKLGSLKPDIKLGHTERLGAESYTFQVTDPKTGETETKHGVRTAKAYAGFGEIYVDPELSDGLKPHFEPGNQKDDSGFITAWNQMAKVAGVGKFMQVILNPAAYPTNFLGGVATEIFNGRLSLNAKGARSYVKFGSARNFGKLPKEPYGVGDQVKFYNTTGAEFAEQGGALSLGRNQLNTEMGQQGIRDNSVLAEDLNQSIELGYGDAVGKVSRALSKAYQAADNAAKRSAFAHELDKWIAAEPESTMDVLVQKAAEDVRLTTQNYDMVPSLLKQFSQRSFFVGTYISFSYELFRNTKNTALLARREIMSGNKVLRRAGYRRVAGMATTGALLYALNQTLSAWMTGLDDDEREELRAQVPPWLKDGEVVFLGADKGGLLYFDSSYLIPHQVFYNAAAGALRGDDLSEKALRTGAALWQGVGGMNIAQQTIAEAVTNQKRGGGPIYNPEITPEGTPGHARAIAKHFGDSMYLPGFMRTYAKFQKAKSEEIGYAGSTATMDDMFLGFLGVRPYRIDTTHENFLKHNLSKFASRSSKAKSHTSEYAQSLRTDEEKLEAESEVTEAQGGLLKEFAAKIKMFKRSQVPNERIRTAVKNARVPKYMKAELPKLLKD